VIRKVPALSRRLILILNLLLSDRIYDKQTSEKICNPLTATESHHELLSGVITGNEALGIGDEVGKLGVWWSTLVVRCEHVHHLPTQRDDFLRA
jgi:hypothetical protein